MPSIFEKIDKIRPLYDAVYKFVLFICKLLLVVDIAITSMSVAGRYISFIPDPAWSEEVVLSCMAYMAVLSAALAIRRGAHIRMTALDSYLLKNTLSENGSVARGVCIKNEDGTLQSVTERTRIEPCDGGAHYTEDGGESWVDLPGDTPVSMNLWGFTKSFLQEAENRFADWLNENLPKNPLKCEYFLPLVVSELIDEKKATVTVLHSADKWYGVTYREDKPAVVNAIKNKIEAGIYPMDLWEEKK